MRRGWRRLDAGFAAHEQWPQRQAQRQPCPYGHAIGCADLEHVSGTHGDADERRNRNTAGHGDPGADRHANGHARAHGDAGANAVTHAGADADANAGADATPTPAPSASPSAITIHAGGGYVNGSTDGQYFLTSAQNTHNNAGEGNLLPGDPDASAMGGGQGDPVDGVPSAATMSENYHVHAFLGLIVNGTEITIPDAAGFVNPFGDYPTSDPCTGGYINTECWGSAIYEMHTHDPSGLIHMEAPSPVCNPDVQGSTPPCDMSIFTLGQFFDIWGVSVNPGFAGNFGRFQGPMSVYTSPLQYAGCAQALCRTQSTSYTQYTGDPRAIQLYSHTAVWIVIGTPPASPSSLPNIIWQIAQ